MGERFTLYANAAGKFEGHIHYTASMSLGFFITQFQRASPTFQGGVVGNGEFLVTMLQILE